MSADEIAGAFLNHFYTTLDSNPDALSGLYQAQSTATIEGVKLNGAESIINKYKSLGKLTHNIPMLTKDVQVSVHDSALIIFVTGQLIIGTDNPNPLHFSHVFQLVGTAEGSYYLHNEIFRLVYA